ncbi:hypothetical protein DPMN_008752 [Dreissena polymorpha]|uniref:Uncharacterized protein n=1 Tax=Dreissena polymorpha TaxID=45954 RepID=A0A9D4MYE1_DREPO|nr:hypothetical protein DPMN_008752 [Dreissena polymorpha]
MGSVTFEDVLKDLDDTNDLPMSEIKGLESDLHEIEGIEAIGGIEGIDGIKGSDLHEIEGIEGIEVKEGLGSDLHEIKGVKSDLPEIQGLGSDLHEDLEFHLNPPKHFQDMAPDTKVPDGTDGRKDGRTDGQRQNNIPPPMAGDNYLSMDLSTVWHFLYKYYNGTIRHVYSPSY